MKQLLKAGIGFLAIFLFYVNCNPAFSVERHWHNDSLPSVLEENRGDLLESNLRSQAILMAATHNIPFDLETWKKTRLAIREKIIQNSGIKVDQKLPLNLRETGTVQMDGYTVKNIYFQTQPGVYATANLYVPEGKGPFPAVVNMHGHWTEGKAAESVQAVGHSLATNGYVCLTIDAFGAGERSTEHGEFEYHGANLGASLMNLGESLLGVQVVDNMRAVDLLVSLPFVDADNLGATGASGGGNQTMWFAALDERIKAALPMVSVGTFESAVMRSNCVCELLPGGLTISETAGVLGLFAPRALKMCNHEQDSNPTFYPQEMLRSYHNAKPVFQMYAAGENIDYAIFDLTHGYWEENREVMLGWFDRHLKGTGTGAPKKERPFELLPVEELMVFEKGKRDPLVKNTAAYARGKGEELRKSFLNQAKFDAATKKEELRTLLKLNNRSERVNVHRYPESQGWERMALETNDGKLVPVLHHAPSGGAKAYTVISNMDGKNAIPSAILDGLKANGSGIMIVELSGTGEASSAKDVTLTRLSRFHTLARAHLWLGKTLMGEWVEELRLVTEFARDTYRPTKLRFDGNKEAGLAAVFLEAMHGGGYDEIIIRKAPVSYLFDKTENIDFFSMGIHLPGILKWGDLSLAAALTGTDISFIDPVTMSGEALDDAQHKQYKAEYEKVRRLCGQVGQTTFNK